MRRLIVFIVPFIWVAALSAQTPQSFSYQAVARDNSGIILDNKPVSFRISILNGSVSGTIAYRETHTSLSTNTFGLVQLEIGKGTPVNGTFSAINWGSNSYFVQVEMDPVGGSNYQVLSTSQLLSVPYALHAKTVETGDNWGSQIIVSDATLTGNGTTSTPLRIADGSVTSAKIQDGSVSTIDLANNAVTTLNIADGTIAPGDLASSVVTSDKLAASAVTAEKISTGAVTGTKIAQNGAASGQALKWDGSTWAPANDETGSGVTTPTGPAGGDLTGSYPDPTIATGKITSAKILDGTIATADLADNAVSSVKITDGAVATADLADNAVTSAKIADATIVNADMANNAVSSTNILDGTIATADLANSTVTTEKLTDLSISTAKIQKESVTSDKLTSNSVTDAKIATGAVTGSKIAQGGATSGQALKWNGTAWAPGNDDLGGLILPFDGTTLTTASAFKVSNSADLGSAITGHATSTIGSSYGIYGQSDGLAGIGVYGKVTHKTGYNYGIFGFSESSGGTGVFGRASSATGETIGVIGRSDSNEGTGVFGVAYSTGATYGVKGSSSSTSGTGVQGEATASSGATEGVTGRSSSTSGTGVFGTASATSGYTHGVFGSTISPNGRAVGARSVSSTGTTYGVHSEVLSSTGFSGYFTGGKFHVSGNVGIGTESPEYRLDVYAPGTSTTGLAIFRNSLGDQKVQIRQISNGAGAVYVYKAGNEQTVGIFGEGNSFIKGGNLGIGTSFPTEALYIVGNAFKTAGGGTWLTSSDLRLKNILGDYNKGLDEIASLQTVRYQYKKDNPRQLDSNVEQVGFIAQEVRKIFPETVTEGIDGYLDFNMHAINVALVNAIKELKAENDKLKSENEKVNTRLEKIEALLNTTVKN